MIKPKQISYFYWRCLGALFFLFGLLIFSVFAFFFTHPNEHTWWEHIRFTLLLSGAVPLVVAFFLLICFKRPFHLFLAITGILPLFIFLHFIVSVYNGHRADSAYYPLQIIEFIAAYIAIKVQVFNKKNLIHSPKNLP